MVPVMKQADRYFKYTKDYWFRSGAQKRGPSTESAGGGFKVDNTPSYYADVFAFHMDVDDQVRTNADQPIDMDRDATQFVGQNLLVKREISFMQTYMKSGLWTGTSDFTPSTKWSASGSNPVNDVETLKQQIKSQTGFMPNTLLVSADVFSALKNNAVIIDRIKYTQTGVIGQDPQGLDLLARLFGVKKFLVSSAVLNTAQEGEAASMQFMATNQALLVYANESPSILQPSAGYIFSWKGLFGAGKEGSRVMSYRMEHLKSDRIEGEMAYAMNVVGSDLGSYLYSLI
jgi:hypothetical protein